MWQTGRKADRTNNQAAPVPVPSRKEMLPPLAPATSELAERMRGFGLLAGMVARWLLVVLALSVGAMMLVQSGALPQPRLPATALEWAQLAAVLTVIAAFLRLRGLIVQLWQLALGSARRSSDPFARLAAEARAARPPRS